MDVFHQTIFNTFSESLILAVGGIDSYGDGQHRHRDAQVVDLSKQTRSCQNLPEYPVAMGMATGAIVSGHPMICGGLSKTNPVWSPSEWGTECYRHSKVSNSWIFSANMNTNRLYSASVMLNGTLFVMGGFGGLSSTEYVSPDGDASRPGPDLPNPRAEHCAVKLSTGQVMLVGGYGGYGGSGMATMFDPDTETFDTLLPSLSADLRNGGCAVFHSAMHDNREVVLAAGGNREATCLVLDYTQPNATWTKSNY